MNLLKQQLWGSVAAALMLAAMGAAPSSNADPVGQVGNEYEPGIALEQRRSEDQTDGLSANDTPRPTEALKVGEYQQAEQEDVVAILEPHDLDGQPAATVYVHNIPVMTFLNVDPANESAEQSNSPALNASDTEDDVKVGEVQSDQQDGVALSAAELDLMDNFSDPVQRATAIAARLNQLHRNNVDADLITVRWDENREIFVIELDGDLLLPVDDATILPNTTENSAEDALQITNLLRRQLGNAEPLITIENMPEPQPRPQAAVVESIISRTLTGMASWYGPGFHGNQSASGEIFDQDALTAAHPSLPFGTEVRVTNLDNGMSVVVRINDRGPYAYGRIIDLSAGAARAVGLIHSGIAPVQVDVLEGVQ